MGAGKGKTRRVKTTPNRRKEAITQEECRLRFRSALRNNNTIFPAELLTMILDSIDSNKSKRAVKEKTPQKLLTLMRQAKKFKGYDSEIEERIIALANKFVKDEKKRAQIPLRFYDYFYGIINLRNKLEAAKKISAGQRKTLKNIAEEEEQNLDKTGLLLPGIKPLVFPADLKSQRKGGVILPNLNIIFVSTEMIPESMKDKILVGKTRELVRHEMIHSNECFTPPLRLDKWGWDGECSFLREGLVEWANRVDLYGTHKRASVSFRYERAVSWINSVLLRTLPHSDTENTMNLALKILREPRGLREAKRKYGLEVTRFEWIMPSTSACIPNTKRRE